jgi:hypothetical protein
MAGEVQLRIEVETEGAEQLTALRTELDRLGSAGTKAFEHLDASLTAVLDKLTLSRSLVADSTRSFLDSQRQLFAGLSPLFDNFFRSVLSGSRSLRDALKRLWSDFLDFFLGLVRRMLATWLDALGLMSGSRTGGLGGLLGGLLGGFFGGTAPAFPFFSSLLPSFGLGLGGGRLPSGGFTSTLLGALFGLPGLGGPVGTPPTFPAPRPGPVFGGLGGLFAGGVLTAVLVGIGKIFQRNKQAREAFRVAREGVAALEEILDAFKRFQIDYESAASRMDAVIQQMGTAWSRLGAPGQAFLTGRLPAPFRAHPRVREALALREQVLTLRGELDRLQAIREQRAQALAQLPIPEFQLGGMVRAIHSAQGRILAFLHAGEAVLNRRAVRALGEAQIERLNREPSRGLGAGRDQFFVEIHAVDGESVERWLARNEARLVRFFRRAARDRGLRPPV